MEKPAKHLKNDTAAPARGRVGRGNARGGLVVYRVTKQNRHPKFRPLIRPSGTFSPTGEKDVLNPLRGERPNRNVAVAVIGLIIGLAKSLSLLRMTMCVAKKP